MPFGAYRADRRDTSDESREQKLDMIPISQVVSGFCLLAKKNERWRTYRKGVRSDIRETAHPKGNWWQYTKRNITQLHIEWGGRPYRSREVMNPYIGNPLKSIERLSME